MTDTAQPDVAAETDPVAAASDAFKASLGQIEQPVEPKPRDERGRFRGENPPEEAPIDDEGEELEGEIDPDAEDADGEVNDEAEDAEGPDDEDDQPAVEMPRSWAADKAELWSELPPETQSYIAEREGQRDNAVNAKFQEAANQRKQYELQAQEAQKNRDTFASLAEAILSDLQPVEPSRSLLDRNSPDYNPEQYRALDAEYQQLSQYRSQLSERLQSVRQQQEADEQRAMQEYIEQVNSKTKDALFQDVPEFADQQKAPAKIQELMEYAVNLGLPAEQFQTPLTALEWHVLHKAKAYDEMKAAEKKIGNKPVKGQPPIRPGVATSRSASKASKFAKDMKRVQKEGSVEAGAAVWKNFL